MDNIASGTGQNGTFAEIGAGQEVSRWFFSVGGAAGTVAKTGSAYDMAVTHSAFPGGEWSGRGGIVARPLGHPRDFMKIIAKEENRIIFGYGENGCGRGQPDTSFAL
jgi:hypothetical protein